MLKTCQGWVVWICVAALALCLSAPGMSQDSFFVATNGVDANSGASWAAALLTISNAVGRSGAGDYIVVSNGTYPVTAPIEFGDRVLRSVNGPYLTIIDGGGATRCVTMTHTNSYLDGFSVINGMAGTGGGIHISGGGVITNCRIIGNVSTSKVDAAHHGGGGVAAAASGARILNCWIYGNSASNGGGGIRVVGTATWLLVRDTTIASNISDVSSYAGGGISSYNGASGGLRLENCVISNNVSKNQGGGLYWVYGTLEIEKCQFIGNSSAQGSGAMRIYTVPNVSIRNSLFAMNTIGPGGYSGGAISWYATGGNSSIDNCTIVSNSAVTGPGGGISFSGTGGNIAVNNTICYYNRGAAGTSNINVAATGVGAVFNHCCAAPTNSLAGMNNIDLAPDLRDWPGADYRLNPSSPCVNAGANAGWMAGAIDLDGRTRIDRFFGKVDIGCYEYILQGTLFGVR